jgi:hypothetical protein
MLFAQAGNLGSVEGQVVNAVTAEPVQGADLTLAGPGGVPRPPDSQPFQASAQSGEQGRFAFSGLRAGRYQLIVRRQGFSQKAPGSTQPTQFLFMLGEGQRLTGYLARLAPESVISGKALSADGDPVAGIVVTASRTNELGEYRVAGLAAGSYVVAASPYDPAAGGPLLRDEAGPVTAATYYGGATNPLSASAVEATFAAETSGIDIKLATVNGVSIRGKVVGDGVAPKTIVVGIRQPTAGAARDFAEGIGVRVDPDGSFLIREVTPGSYNLFARQDAAHASDAPPTLAQRAIEVSDKNLDGTSALARSYHPLLSKNDPGILI